VAIIVVFDIPGGTQAQYEQVTDRLTGGRGLPKAASDWPVAGLLSHAAGPSPTGWLVTDVWESREQFDAFAQVLLPLTAEAGMNAQPQFYEAFNVVT
jgi:hypothetical protein